MEPVRLWAAVCFTAQNGGTEAFLSAAAQAGLHLYGITPLPGGVCAHCAAGRYAALARLARRHRVRLRIRKKQGLYFRFRAVGRRAGLWVGLFVFVPLLLWAQGLVWAVDYGTLTLGQKTRAAALLREYAALTPGSAVSEQALSAGEYALAHSGEFSWASLNFLNGRLQVEAAAAEPVPAITSGTLHGLRAKAEGTVVSTNLISGTMLVSPGQQVAAGQGLIGTARSERDGTLIFEPAAGQVLARLVWRGEYTIPLQTSAEVLTGSRTSSYRLSFAGHAFTLLLPFGQGEHSAAKRTVRHWQPELLGLPLPLFVEETTYYEQEAQLVTYTENGALALARLRSLQELAAAYPDAQIKKCREAASVSGGALHFTVAYSIVADLCE